MYMYIGGVSIVKALVMVVLPFLFPSLPPFLLPPFLLLREWLGGVDSETARQFLHTQYHSIEKMNSALNIKW